MLQSIPIARSDTRQVSARAFVAPLAATLIIALLVPMFLAGPAHLTSDESLYLAEAYNVAAGKGMTYPSGEAIVQRAPLFPLVLAPAVKLGGPDAAYAVTKSIIAVDALLVLALAWRLRGPLAGCVAGCAAGASAYLSGLGTTLYLDPFQCALLLLMLIALRSAVASRSVRMYAIAGALSGGAFLAKESAAQWAPVAIVVVLALPSARNRAGALGAAAYSAALGMATVPWWIWVYVHTGELFLVGEITTAKIAGGCGAVGVLAAIAVGGRRAHVALSPGVAGIGAVAIIALSGAFFLYGLTAYSTWPYPNDYASSIPRYLTQVAPQMQPYYVIVAAWLWLLAQAVRSDDEEARFVAASALLFAPFALFAANRWLQLRDALPLVYLSYVVLGMAVADGWNRLRRPVTDGGFAPAVAAGLVAVAGVMAVHEAMAFRGASADEAERRAIAGSWDSPYTRDVAAWMDANLPGGARVLTSRPYFSSLHVETNARFRIRQLPTVRVDVDPARATPVQARSNLFRWEDADLRATAPGDTWLHLARFPNKGYWVGLSEQELLEYIAAHDIEYVVLTGTDIAFGSSAYAWYFSANPAFTRLGVIEGTPGDLMFAYAVDRAKLQPIAHSTSIHPRDYAALSRMTGLDAAGLSAMLGTPMRVTDVDGTVSPREREAAEAGIDLGSR